MDDERQIEVPAATAWPLTMALGLALVSTGLVTAAVVSQLGGLLAFAGAVGWLREVLPRERVERVAIVPETAPPLVAPRPATTLPRVGEAQHRARLPVEIYPVTAGIKGGLVGGAAMALCAVVYGLVAHHSPWYPINLLVAGLHGGAAATTTDELLRFDGVALVIASVIHGLTSLLVGTLYGAMLPMFPRRPLLVGGLVAPLLWTGLLRPAMFVLNPTLAARVSWGWFIASQLAFGLAAGWVVSRSERVRTLQSEPYAARIGIERGPEP